MGKKKITKQAKAAKPSKVEIEEKPVEVEKVEKKAKKGAKQSSSNFEVFTPSFYGTLNNFQTFYKEVLQLKSEANHTNVSDELKDVTDRVSSDLEFASTRLLKNELVVLQKWISEERQKLVQEINTVKKCYEDNQKSLHSTGAFSHEQISKQLKPIQSKIDEKQEVLNNYGKLLERSQGIYAVDNKIEEEKQAPVDEPEQDNKAEDGIDMNIDV